MRELSCFICNRKFSKTIVPKYGAVGYDCDPFIVQEKYSLLLKAPVGTILYHHKDSCGPRGRLWVKLFGENEVNRTLQKNEENENGNKNNIPKDQVWEQFLGRIKYMEYMDTRRNIEWTVGCRHTVVTKTKEGRITITENGKTSLNSTVNKLIKGD